MKKNNWEISEFGWDGVTGVYCVCTIEDNKTLIHYIGSSKNIGKRVNNPNHHYRKLIDLNKNAFIKYKETQDYINLEKQLIYRIKPTLNIQHNG